MQFSTNLRQTLRVPARTALYLLLIAILTAFFALSLNLWRNSQANLKLADEAYQTIAVMELYADVDERGRPVTDLRSAENYAGYLPTDVTGYDLAPIVSAPGVLSYDLRTRYGAYVPGALALRPFAGSPNQNDLFFQHNLIRFTVNAPTPVILLNQKSVPVKINVHEDAVGLLAADYRFRDTPNVYLDGYGGYLRNNAETIRALAGGDEPAEETVVLQPGVEYIASIFAAGASRGIDDPPEYRWFSALGIANDLYGAERWIAYSTNGEWFMDAQAAGQPFALQRYDEVQNNQELSAYFAAVKQAYHISARSFGVIATDDVQAVPAFHLGSTYMRQGRVFTQAEYDQGARVCMVSAQLASLQDWSVGDRIDMEFYEDDCFSSGFNQLGELAPIYTSPQADDFFAAGEYAIVGIFDMRPMTGRSSVSEGALTLPWNALFVPKRSLSNAPADETQPISGALLTIRLQNGGVGAFLDAMEALGLTGKKAGVYEARFTFYDQGYAQMQPSLMALAGTAELLLALSSALLICAAVLLAFFYALAQKQNLGVMRLLGCSRLRAYGAVLLGALLIAAVGVGTGAAAGHALTERVGSGILAQATDEAAAHLAYSAMLATDQGVTLQLALGADWRVTLLALMGSLAVFMLCTGVFTARYVSQEPRSLLPQGHE